MAYQLQEALKSNTSCQPIFKDGALTLLRHRSEIPDCCFNAAQKRGDVNYIEVEAPTTRWAGGPPEVPRILPPHHFQEAIQSLNASRAQNPFVNEFSTEDLSALSDYMARYSSHPIQTRSNAPASTPQEVWISLEPWLAHGQGPCQSCRKGPHTLLPNHVVPPPTQPEKPVCHTEPRWPGGNPGTITPPPELKIVRPTPPSEMLYLPVKHEEPPCDTKYRWAAGNKELKCCTPEQRQSKHDNRYRATCRCRETERINKPGSAQEITIQQPSPQTFIETVAETERPNFNCNYGYEQNMYLNIPVAGQATKLGFQCPDTCKDKIHASVLPSNNNTEKANLVILPTNQNIFHQKPAVNRNITGPGIPGPRIPGPVVKRQNRKPPCTCKRLSSFDYCSQW
ncbi:hypothetical protein O0L34_g8615 [Tuta absoluta]|nr:hypothetical protein O0L34_g8615 [Tuta absoluta]